MLLIIAKQLCCSGIGIKENFAEKWVLELGRRERVLFIYFLPDAILGVVRN